MTSDKTPDKPWNKQWSKLWMFLIKGKRRFVTVPIFVIGSIFIFLPTIVEKTSGGQESFNKLFFPKAILSRSENDILNEWVAFIREYSNQDSAEKGRSDFLEEFKKLKYREGAYIKDTYVVRSLNSKKAWWLVIDMGRGPSSSEEVLKELQGIKDYSWKHSRKAKSSVIQHIDNAEPILYDEEKFQKKHGRIRTITDKQNK